MVTANTIYLAAADPTGIPTRAHCAGCGATWERRLDDPAAIELVTFSVQHRGCSHSREV